MKKSITIIITAFLIFGSFLAGLYTPGQALIMQELAKKEVIYLGKVMGKYTEVEPDKIAQNIDFDLFWKTWDTLYELYVDGENITDKKLFYGALEGMVRSVGDPYTVFMDPKESVEFNDDMRGKFEGIGAEIGIKNEILTVVAPLSDTPADKAGLKPGDKILEINGESTSGLSIDEAVNRIRGPKGTEVILSIYRDGFEKIKEFAIVRDTIVVESIKTEIIEDDIYLVKIRNFNGNIKNSFDKTVKDILEKKPKGIILDLRINPGGYLESAIEIASDWIEKDVVVIEQFREGRKNEHIAKGMPRLKDLKTVVLVDEGSASASEIVAGALQDHKKAVIVGKKTFGKGSVQTVQYLKDGSSIKVTIAKWLTPKGRSINDEGIMPDIEVDYTLEDYEAGRDPQLEAAVKVLNGISLEEVRKEYSATSTEIINQ